MGNKQEKSKVVFNISLDNSVYLPGENITGKVEIIFKEQLEVDQFPNPKMTFSIIQHRHWECTFSSEDDKSIFEGELNKNYFLERANSFTHAKDENKFQGIKYSFIYTIPNDIIPSLEFPHEKYEFAYIRNYFCVKIPELDSEKQILIIIQKYPDKVQRLLKIAKEEDTKKSFTKKGGIIRIEASYPKYSFPILSNMPVSVFVKASNGDVKVKEVNINLKRLVEYKNKNSDKIYKRIKQTMFSETRKIKDNEENLLFQIPFKDGKDVNYYFSKTMYGTKDEICCILPNVETNIINVSYYIKIVAIPNAWFNKNIDLKLNVDFHSKGEKNLNDEVFNNFRQTVVKINSGKLPIGNEGPFLNYISDIHLNEADFNKNVVFIKKSSNNLDNMKNININKNNIININNINANNNFGNMNNMNNLNMNNMNNMNNNNMNNLNMNNMNNISNMNKVNNLNMNNINNMNKLNNKNNMNMNMNNVNTIKNKNMNNMNKINNMNMNNISNMNKINNMNMNMNNMNKLNNKNNMNMNMNNMNINNLNNMNMNNISNMNRTFMNNMNMNFMNNTNMNLMNNKNMNLMNNTNMNFMNNTNMNFMNNMNMNQMNNMNMNQMNNNNFTNMNFLPLPFGDLTLPSMTEVQRGHNLVYMNNNINNNTNLHHP